MNPTRLIRRQEVEHLTGLARSTIYARMKAGTFPRPISLGGNRLVAWIEQDIHDWISERINQSSCEVSVDGDLSSSSSP